MLENEAKSISVDACNKMDLQWLTGERVGSRVMYALKFKQLYRRTHRLTVQELSILVSQQLARALILRVAERNRFVHFS
jgi:hypothetical protein